MKQESDRPRAHLERWPIRIRELTLLRRENVTPRMLRIILGGPNMEGFESHISDEHVKLLFPDPPHDRSKIPTQDGDRLRWPKPIVTSRDYTVRSYDRARAEVAIDVVRHPGGLASEWAASAPLGSTIWVAGPPRGTRVPDAFTWRAYLGDETALPAIARSLEELPRSTRGVVLVQIAHDEERQSLPAPPGMTVEWISRDGAPAGITDDIVTAARSVEIPRGGGAYVWYGGERSALKELRAWVREAGLGPGEFDLSGYWRRGAQGNQLGAAEIVHAVKHLLHIPH